MTMIDTLFHLEPTLDNPVFRGFAVEDTPSLLGREDLLKDFFPADRSNWNWEAERLSSVWKVPRFEDPVAAFNDYPCLSMFVSVFSEQAVDSLRDLLEANGELLPVDSLAGKYYAYNVTTIVEILKRDRNEPPKTLSSVNFYDVYEDRIQDLTIFRTREDCMKTVVTNVFVDRVKQSGLNGFHFVKVWPFPPGVKFSSVEAQRRRAEGQKVKTSRGDLEVKGQSMVISLALSEGKMTKEEKKLPDQFAKELDAQLLVTRIDGDYFGFLEGRKTAKGVTRLVLSCPDHELLLNKLRPWLKALPWPGKLQVLLRDESWDDYKCEERPVEI